MAGHVQKRGNNSYLLVYHLGYDADGKRLRKTKTVKAKNKSEAEKKLAAFVTEIELGAYIAPANMNVSEFSSMWKKEQKKKLAPSTLETYTYVLDARIIPSLGYLKLDKVLPIHITDLFDGLKKEGLSSSSVMKCYEVLSSMFKLAIRNELIKNNPLDKVDRPVVTNKPGEVYDSEELKLLYTLLNKEKNKQMVLLFKLALLTGMRKGEILALQWDDVDFKTNTIHVRNSLAYTKDLGYYLKEPKTKNSIRQIAPPRQFMEELKKHIFIKKTERMEASELWEGGEYYFVFSTTFGKPFHLDYPNRWWKRFFERINKDKKILKQIRFHDLRHTAATTLINKGANIHSISKRLGHSNIKTTMNIYGHYLEEADQKIADMLDEDYI